MNSPIGTSMILFLPSSYHYINTTHKFYRILRHMCIHIYIYICICLFIVKEAVLVLSSLVELIVIFYIDAKEVKEILKQRRARKSKQPAHNKY